MCPVCASYNEQCLENIPARVEAPPAWVFCLIPSGRETPRAVCTTMALSGHHQRALGSDGLPKKHQFCCCRTGILALCWASQILRDLIKLEMKKHLQGHAGKSVAKQGLN